MIDALKLIKADEEGNFLCNFGSITLSKGLDPTKIGYDAVFEGEASNEKRDDQNQVILQKGLNFEPFLDAGMYKDAHPFKDEDGRLIYRPKTVGEPVGYKAMYEPDTNRWVCKGRFLPHVQEARQLVDLQKSFLHNQSPRTLKFSVEGKIRDITDDGQKVLKADVYNIVITENPVNKGTYLDILAKSMNMFAKSLGATSESIASFKREDLEGAATPQIPPGLLDLSKYRNKLIDEVIKLHRRLYKKDISRKQAAKYADSYMMKNTIKAAGGKHV